MKTIQKVLSELDAEKLIDYYITRYRYGCLEKISPEAEGLTISEYKQRVHDKIQGLIDRLVNMEPNTKDAKSILFVYKSVGDYYDDDLDVGLIDVDELLNASDLYRVQTYGYEYERFEDTIGYLVADTALTQNHLLELVTSYLYEVSFFGYEQEHLEEERQMLEDAIRETKEHPKNHDEWDVLKFSEEILDEKYPEEEAKLEAYYRAGTEYADYCKVMELDRIRSALLADADKRTRGTCR